MAYEIHYGFPTDSFDIPYGNRSTATLQIWVAAYRMLPGRDVFGLKSRQYFLKECPALSGTPLWQGKKRRAFLYMHTNLSSETT